MEGLGGWWNEALTSHAATGLRLAVLDNPALPYFERPLEQSPAILRVCRRVRP